MNLDQILLLSSIVVPALVSVLLFSGLIDKDEWAKQRAQFKPLMIRAEDDPMMVKA